MQSGQPEGIPRDYGLDVPKVANITGCTNVDKVKELDCLRKVDAVELKRAISPYILNSYGSLSGGTPVEDNVTLLTRPEYIIRGAAGRFAKIVSLALARGLVLEAN